MAKKKRKARKDEPWAEAKRLCRLSEEDVRMAKELGMGPDSLIKNRPSPSQQWKLPIKDWIRELYAKKKPASPSSPAAEPRLELPMAAPDPDASADLDLDRDEFDLVDDRFEDDPDLERLEDEPDDERGPWFEMRRSGPPDSREIADQNKAMQGRQQQFRVAAEYVARAFSEFAEVQKVVLFGSVAVPLKKEVPRFSEFRRYGIEVYHECKDVDLAVWLTRLDNLHALGRARGQAVNRLLTERNMGVAHHQVDIFVMEPGTDRYLGRLCTFGECPKGKPECLVPSCGATLFLQQHSAFRLRPEAFASNRTVVLFERVARPRSTHPADTKGAE